MSNYHGLVEAGLVDENGVILERDWEAEIVAGCVAEVAWAAETADAPAADDRDEISAYWDARFRAFKRRQQSLIDASVAARRTGDTHDLSLAKDAVEEAWAEMEREIGDLPDNVRQIVAAKPWFCVFDV